MPKKAGGDAFQLTLKRLSEVSRKQYDNPYEAVEWPDKLDEAAWLTSPELISLYGTELYASLAESQRKRLAFFEAVNFFSLNIHGEKSLVEGLAHRLYAQETPEISEYLHHFLDEENKHMVYFGGFCQRYAGKIYADRKLTVPREYAPGEEELLFFAKVMIFEEIVDVYNRKMADDERLAPVARRINWLHHRDEARHLVFGRETVARLAQRSLPAWDDDTRSRVRRYLSDYVEATWKEFYNPDVYADAGIAEPYAAQRAAWAHSACREHRRAVAEPCVSFLRKHNLWENGEDESRA